METTKRETDKAPKSKPKLTSKLSWSSIPVSNWFQPFQFSIFEGVPSQNEESEQQNSENIAEGVQSHNKESEQHDSEKNKNKESKNASVSSSKARQVDKKKKPNNSDNNKLSGNAGVERSQSGTKRHDDKKLIGTEDKGCNSLNSSAESKKCRNVDEKKKRTSCDKNKPIQSKMLKNDPVESSKPEEEQAGLKTNVSVNTVIEISRTGNKHDEDIKNKLSEKAAIYIRSGTSDQKQNHDKNTIQRENKGMNHVIGSKGRTDEKKKRVITEKDQNIQSKTPRNTVVKSIKRVKKDDNDMKSVREKSQENSSSKEKKSVASNVCRNMEETKGENPEKDKEKETQYATIQNKVSVNTVIERSNSDNTEKKRIDTNEINRQFGLKENTSRENKRRSDDDSVKEKDIQSMVPGKPVKKHMEIRKIGSKKNTSAADNSKWRHEKKKCDNPEKDKDITSKVPENAAVERRKADKKHTDIENKMSGNTAVGGDKPDQNHGNNKRRENNGGDYKVVNKNSEPDDATDYDLDDDYQGIVGQSAAEEKERAHSASPTIPIQYHDGSMLLYQPPAHSNRRAAQGKRGGKFSTKLVTFYRNGDKHFKGLQLPVSKKNFNTWDTLVNYLGQKIYLPYGVRHIYTLGGHKVTDITQLVDGKAYVCASGEFASKVQYGNQQNTRQLWQNDRPQAGIRATDRTLLNRDSNLDPEDLDEIEYPSSVAPHRGHRGSLTHRGSLQASNVPPTQFADPTMAMAAMPVAGVRAKLKPRVITIISNTHRASRARILLNPRTAQSFEQVLRDMSTSITMTNPPIRQLFTWMTEAQVLSFNQLFNDYKDHDTFIACGTESIIKSTQLSSGDSASEDMSPRVVDNRARERVKAVQQDERMVNGDERMVNGGGKQRRKSKRQDPGRNGTHTQTGYPRGSLSSDDAFSPRSSVDDGPAHHHHQHQALPPLRPRRAFASSGSEDSIGSPLPVPEKRRGGRPHRQSYQGQPMEIDSSTSSSGNGYGIKHRTRLKKVQQYENGDAETGASNSESAAESGDQDGMPKRKSKARTFRNFGRAYRALIAPIKVEIHGKEKEFYPPGNLDPKEVSKYRAPQQRLKLEWVYGYRGLDSRNNLFVLPSGELLYTVGAVAVMYDTEADQQRHYIGHNEDITSIAVHPSGTFIATGQMNGNLPETTPPDIAICHSAHVRVWEVNSLCTHAILGLEFFEVGISCLSFSNENNGEWLMVVDQSEDHILSLWSWNDDNLIAKSNQQTDIEDVVVGVFHPFDDNLIVTAGKQHLFFWNIKNKKITREKKSGIFEGTKPAYVPCIEFSHTGDVLTGDSGGNITVWEKDNDGVYRMRYCIQHAHERYVSAMCMLEDGTLLSGGGLDRRLLAWDSLQGYQSAKIERMFTESAGGIRTIAQVNPGSPDGRIVLGTTTNHIMVGSLQNKFEYVLQGHYSELWALAAHPTELGFATAGYDQNVMFWRAEDHKLLWKVNVEKPCLSCTFNPIGTVLAVGTTVGRFVVLNTEDGMHVTSVQVGRKHISVIKYSPDGTLLALGSHDFRIYLFSVMDDGLVYRRLGALEGHNNFLTHLDWAEDNRHLQSVSGDYDLHFWDAIEVRREKPEKVTELTWSTQSCIMGYTVAGVWPTREKGADINTLDKSHSGELLVAGDNHGFISLLTYPCSNLKAESQDIKHNSSHVTSLQFLYGDACVVATGGIDACLMQFVLEDKSTRGTYDAFDDDDGDHYAP